MVENVKRALFGVISAACVAGCASTGALEERGSGSGDGGGSGGFELSGPGSGGGNGEACAVASSAVKTRPVDVIVAVDQSASMGEEIQGVVDNINQNLGSILAASNIDYRVVLIGGAFCIQPPLGPSTTAPDCYGSNAPRFLHANAPVNSSDALTLFLWTYDGFYKAPNTCSKVATPELAWKDFLRFEAMKVFMVVSDDDPQSFSAASLGCSNCPNHQCPTFADKPADWGGADFPTELYALEPKGMFGTPAQPKWTMHAIVPVDQELGPAEALQPLDSVCSFNGNTGETSGLEYQKLAKLTGGMRFPSCDADYSPVFQKIASTILPLACVYELGDTGLGAIDPSKTNVTVTSGGSKETILKDDTKPCDAGADGWQFLDGTDRIKLCGSACAAVKADPGANVSITVGCKTQSVNPN